ncbi:MAG: fumarylacetoacetate hydrolase family protein [Deltaproteobacteria bacterium]|nr:fumarylacetoacetate hydrolase family protein [Deltaproteobacteria bacterium]MBW1929318.1 fumarylacetoacetate hydrolase family protein [Deltaproteobacteria bacterium]MBW2026998.1 fumarylacetoacetate hydrolase family protein [Deltaproteobacteria bacterium]MBW2127180.1 fumarylacetoacetate hydrolase family protein [Deltaproteobacteria bacterium]RLB22514.1 MAG: 2-hydroxyhepta-2,4-diene-1,7-dioate isomerase [Deltaproteobacteria bacterium]
MKFARFSYHGRTHTGVIRQGEIAVLSGSLFTHFEETGESYALSDIKFLPPTVPTKVVCIGLNYYEHIEEIGAQVPEKPIYFLKPPSSLIGHESAILYPKGAERVDYEGELAIVIKKKMKDVPEHKTMEYVLGLSCFNDVTERALVSKNPLLLTLSKGFDTFGPIGPYLVTDLDPNNLNIRTYLNGRLMQEGNTKNCVFNVQQILHHLSTWMTLLPGDIVATGTPKGIAPMKPGDVVEVEIEGIGKLRNRVE